MNKHILKTTLNLTVLCVILMASSAANAACSNNEDGVPGTNGEIEYFTGDDTLRYCDDTNWVDMVDTTETRTNLGGNPNKRVVFVTSTTNAAGSKSDAQCQARAEAAGLKGQYKVWFSSSDANDPESTFEQSTVPYVLVNGLTVADDWADLIDGSLQNRINRYETGGTYTGFVIATDTQIDGTWDSDADVTTGNGYNTNSTWTDTGSTVASGTGSRAYCFEQGGLIAHWKLDETTGTTAADSSGNGYNLTVDTELPSNSVTGKIDTAFDFLTAGTDSEGDFTAPTSVTQNTKVTISMWLKQTDTGPVFQGLLETDSWFKLRFAFSTSVIFSDNTYDTSGNEIGPSLDLNQWNHIAVTYDFDDPATSPIFYKDGIVSTDDWDTVPSGTYNAPISQTMRLGRRIDSSGSSFHGEIDDVRLYNRVLSASEIEVLASCTGPGTYSYNFTDDVMQWCNDVDSAVKMGSNSTVSGDGTCSSPSSSEGAMDYFSTDETLYYCNGTQWVPIGRECTNCGGDAGEKIAFITNQSKRPRNLSGITGADAICQSEAEAAGLSGTYLAWIADSDPTSAPATRFSADIKGTLPIVMTDGTEIASNWSDLTDGSISDQLDTNAYGAQRRNSVAYATTNVSNDGTQANATDTCTDWTTDDGSAIIAGRYDTTTLWTSHPTTRSCNDFHAIYCFEQ